MAHSVQPQSPPGTGWAGGRVRRQIRPEPRGRSRMAGAASCLGLDREFSFDRPWGVVSPDTGTPWCPWSSRYLSLETSVAGASSRHLSPQTSVRGQAAIVRSMCCVPDGQRPLRRHGSPHPALLESPLLSPPHGAVFPRSRSSFGDGFGRQSGSCALAVLGFFRKQAASSTSECRPCMPGSQNSPPCRGRCSF